MDANQMVSDGKKKYSMACSSHSCTYKVQYTEKKNIKTYQNAYQKRVQDFLESFVCRMVQLAAQHELAIFINKKFSGTGCKQ